jgi:hypothetical protein
LSLRLLQAMGYGGKEALLTHTGKPGDAGLDGIIRQDALGLDLVGVQAKAGSSAAARRAVEVESTASWANSGGFGKARSHSSAANTCRLNEIQNGRKARSTYRLGEFGKYCDWNPGVEPLACVEGEPQISSASRQLRTAGVGSFSKFLWGATSVSGRSCRF